LSDRLTMQNGVALMGIAATVALLYTQGRVDQLVVMYSINVFVTFSLSQIAMCRYWWHDRAKHPDWARHIVIHVIGTAMCVFILSFTVYEKFSEGAWKTLVVTSLLIGFCFWVRWHYRKVQQNLKRLDDVLHSLPSELRGYPKKIDPRAPTAALLVGSYAGL